MSFSIGIIGLPNVGKSTLFNALTKLQALAANYPFATIEPNVGVVPVPDERLFALAKLENSKEIIPTAIEFVDIAGLVKGAHKGAGLGNQFLSHIREVEAIAEVVRFFEDENVVHVENKIDPKADMETIETELTLADLQMVEKKLETLRASAKGGSPPDGRAGASGGKSKNKDDLLRLSVAQKYFDALKLGKMANVVALTEEESKYHHEFPLLTGKPILYVANVKNNAPQPPLNVRGGEGELLYLDCQLESEIAQLPENERATYLKELNLEESGLDKLIKASYKLLDLITFFTAGPKETRAWTIKRGTKASQAAGVIHTDFEKGFIKAEVINWQVLLESGGWNAAKEKGVLRQEGKEYVIADGDVVHFRFNI